MSILVIAEHDEGILQPSTLNTVGAAKELGAEIDLLVLGDDCDSVNEFLAKEPYTHSCLLYTSPSQRD